MGSPCALNAGWGRSSRAYFGWRGAGRKGFGFIQSPKRKTITIISSVGKDQDHTRMSLLDYLTGVATPTPRLVFEQEEEGDRPQYGLTMRGGLASVLYQSHDVHCG